MDGPIFKRDGGQYFQNSSQGHRDQNGAAEAGHHRKIKEENQEGTVTDHRIDPNSILGRLITDPVLAGAQIVFQRYRVEEGQ